MHIKSILAGTAIALAASFGSAWAGDGFATLDGVAAVPMTSEHMEAIRGMTHTPPGIIVVTSGEGAEVIPNGTFPASPPPAVVVDGDVVGFYGP